MQKLAVGISDPGSCRRTGVTLVELLVVVVIGTILTALAIVRFQPFSSASAVADETQRLLVGLDRACDRAILTGNARGLEFQVDGYAFRVLEAGRWREASAEQAPSPRRWPAGMRARVWIDGVAPVSGRETGMPQVVCTGVEAPVPFRLELTDSTSSSTVEWP